MESDWLKFFELVERLHAVSPGLVELALRYRKNQEVFEEIRPIKNQEVLKEVERELGEGPREPFFQEPNKVNLRRCQEFLGNLRKQEDHLREIQETTTRDLLQIQAGRRAFEETLKEMLRAERRSFASDKSAQLHATEEEVVAGLQELKERGGLELHQFIGELEQVLHDRERTGFQ
jgi:hypothetical protein